MELAIRAARTGPVLPMDEIASLVEQPAPVTTPATVTEDDPTLPLLSSGTAGRPRAVGWPAVCGRLNARRGY
jgi:hypothetical protein